MKNQGLDDQMIQAASFCVVIEQCEFEFPTDEFKKILGRTTKSVKDFLKDSYKH